MKRREFIKEYTRLAVAKWKADGARVSELVMSEIEMESNIAPKLWRKHRWVLSQLDRAELDTLLSKLLG